MKPSQIQIKCRCTFGVVVAVPGRTELFFGFSGGSAGGGTGRGAGGGKWVGNGTNAAVSNAFVHFCLHMPLFVVHELAMLWQRHFLKKHRRCLAGGTSNIDKMRGMTVVM